jgi:hypothetical protein
MIGGTAHPIRKDVAQFFRSRRNILYYAPLCTHQPPQCGEVMPKDKEQDLFGTLGDEHVLPRIKPLSRVQRRLIRSAVEIEADDPESLLFQHTVFCQTGLPYRDPGADAREWEREQGSVALKVPGRPATPRPESGSSLACHGDRNPV